MTVQTSGVVASAYDGRTSSMFAHSLAAWETMNGVRMVYGCEMRMSVDSSLVDHLLNVIAIARTRVLIYVPVLLSV